MQRCIFIVGCLLSACGPASSVPSTEIASEAASAELSPELQSERSAVVKYRVDLLRDPGSNCELGASALPGTGTPGYGTASIRLGHDARISAQASLRGGTPNSEYQVYLIQSAGLGGGSFDCFEVDGKLTTNARGNGNIHLDEAVLSGATRAHVYMYKVSPVERFDTVVVNLSAQ